MILSIRNVLFIAVLAINSICCGQIRLLSYNLLNFPTGNLQGREDTLANIIDYTRPHLLMIQELKTAQGLEDITDMMNDLNYGDFASAEFTPQQSPGSVSNPLQQSIVFDTEVLRLKSQGIVFTDYRDINEYILYLNDPSLANGSDTTFLYVYVTHLKSSTGTDNEQERLSMVNYLIEHFATIPEDSYVIFAGDFNLYTNTEPAYLAITSESNSIVMKDIYASYGDWPGSNFSHKEILTQCTRSAMIFDDGASGGVDDRFDFILFSENLTNTDNALHYVPGSFNSIGNNGTCYNESITACASGNDVPDDVLQSIYYMSDHIPQYCELQSDVINQILEETKSGLDIRMNNNIIGEDDLTIFANSYRQMNCCVEVLDINGKMLSHQNSVTNRAIHISTHDLPSGLYFIRVSSENEKSMTTKFIKGS